MRYFIDEEFIEDGKTIDLVSIGIVCEDGRELYLQSVEYDPSKASQWVKENVLVHLVNCELHVNENRDADYAYHAALHGECGAGRMRNIVCPWRGRRNIKHEVTEFVDIKQYGKPEFWGYYSAYDHVALCQLFGTMMDLPPGYPMLTYDIKQLCDSLGNPPLPKQVETEHNALADARHNRVMWDFLQAYTTEGSV